jgi:hypothetical protein
VKVLLDECVDRRLARDISGHDVQTVPDRGWAAVKSGELLGLAAREVDVFITVDRQLPYQQEVSRLALAVVVMRTVEPSRGLASARAAIDCDPSCGQEGRNDVDRVIK